jgi:beta-galactosidase/beta-glucuronidase
MRENFGCWYIQATGIWKTVWLEFVPETSIASVKITPVLSEGKLELEFVLAFPKAADPANLALEIAVSFGDKKITSLSLPVTRRQIRADMDIVSYEACEWGIFTWTPEHPNLYDISFRLRENGEILDEVLSYFGMREIRIDGTNILLNGTPLYQRLILDQGFWKDSYFTPPDEDALVTEIEKTLALGYNGVRKHQKTEDEKFLYWADVKGLLVWSEVAATYEFNDRAVLNFTREWMDIVQQNYNHPSIIVWTPFNESWGVPGIKNDVTQQRFTQAIYFLTKSFDRERPVIVNDGWEHTISDIITLHDYEEDAEKFLERYRDHMDEILDNTLYHSTSRSAFAGGFACRDKPVILSEFGGIAFAGGKGWGYGNKVDSKEDFVKRFDAITTAIKKVDRICGYCYTQISDVQEEINGFLDAERNFKIEPEIIREINERKVGSLQRNFPSP